MKQNKITYTKDGFKIVNIKVNGKEIPDCSSADFAKIVAEELAKQDKGEK